MEISYNGAFGNKPFIMQRNNILKYAHNFLHVFFLFLFIKYFNFASKRIGQQEKFFR